MPWHCQISSLPRVYKKLCPFFSPVEIREANPEPAVLLVVPDLSRFVASEPYCWPAGNETPGRVFMLAFSCDGTER